MEVVEENRGEGDNLVIQWPDIHIEPINYDNLFQGNPPEDPEIPPQLHKRSDRDRKPPDWFGTEEFFSLSGKCLWMLKAENILCISD